MAPNGSLYLLLLFFITMDGSTLFLVVLYVESSKATTSICILEDRHSLKPSGHLVARVANCVHGSSFNPDFHQMGHLGDILSHL